MSLFDQDFILYLAVFAFVILCIYIIVRKQNFNSGFSYYKYDLPHYKKYFASRNNR